MEILFDTHHLNQTVGYLQVAHVSVQDILKELNARLSTVSLYYHTSNANNYFIFQVECVLHGHITVDGTFVVLSVPTKSPGSAMMVGIVSQ